MAIKITYFVHGTTVDNKRGIASGLNDIMLSELGVKQSQELRNQIKDTAFDVVFCSDLKRARESAQLAFSETAPIITDARLRECDYGEYNGTPAAVVEPIQEKMITEKFPGEESYEDVKVRVADFLELLKNNYD